MRLLQKHLNVRTDIVAIPFNVWMSGQEDNSSKARRFTGASDWKGRGHRCY